MKINRANMMNPLLCRLFFAKDLPLAFVAGLRLHHIDEQSCNVQIKYGWRNTNPFGSMYFAAQCMASELSTGALGMIAREECAPNRPAMLVSQMKSSFSKPARGLITFKCENGLEIKEAIKIALRDASSERVLCTSKGFDEAGDQVSEFEYEWWFSSRKKKT
jgi:hypothetical protein